MRLFWREILEGKESWKIKQENLACELAFSEALSYCYDNTAHASNGGRESPLEDEVRSLAWLAEVDERLDEVSGVLTCLQDSPAELKRHYDTREANQELFYVSENRRQRLADFQAEFRRLRNGLDAKKKPEWLFTPSQEEGTEQRLFKSVGPKRGCLSGEKLMHHLLRWWRPLFLYHNGHTQRLAEARKTEVDGRFVH